MIANIEAERAVIGDIMLDAEQVMPEAVRLSPEDFSVPEYRAIFKTAKELFRECRPVDAVTVTAQLGQEYSATILQAAEATPAVSNYRFYVDAVEEAARKRKAWDGTAELLNALEESRPIQDCQNLASDISQALCKSGGFAEFTAAEGYLDFCNTKEHPREYLKTGFHKLDSLTFIDRGDYIVIGGRPSTGKTALTLQMLLNMAKEHKAVYFSLETNRRKIFERLVACYTGTPMEQIKRCNISDWNKVVNRYDSFAKLNLKVVEAAGWTVEEIRAKALQEQAEIIFIDYLSLLKAEGRSLYEKVSNISIDLHTMAQNCGITVVALSQLNRAGTGEPDMASLRESGQIEQDADCIMLLHNAEPENPNGHRFLILAKNKEGQTGKLPIRFNGATQRFMEVETRYDQA